MNQSFDVTTKSIIAHRKANPALVKKHGWATSYPEVANELDAYNDARCRAHGWIHYVTSESPPPFLAPRSSLPLRPGGAAGEKGGSRIVAGIKTLLDWLGSGGQPVAKELAEKRALVCATCPQNGRGDWTRWFTVPASQKIKKQLEIRNDLKLATSQDGKLGVCEACLCPLHLKTWAPLEHILKEMDEATKAKLNQENPRCWILSESEV
jgi:hypothetical protein